MTGALNSNASGDWVIVIGPPWARSGSARVIQNQIEFYRNRGYRTLFVGVGIHWAYWRTSPIWDSFREGAPELGADHVAIAALDQKKFIVTKLAATMRHSFFGTQLDWIVAIGRSAQLLEEDARFISELPVALIHVNHVYTLGFAQKIRRKLVRNGKRVPLILETHDIQSNLLLERGDKNPWTQRPDSLNRLLKAETRLMKQADVLVHLSVSDFKFFKAQLPQKPHILTMPTINETFIGKTIASNRVSTEKIDLLFVGQFYHPNLVALEWFFSEVWPRIQDRRYELKIVGPVDKLVAGTSPQTYEKFRSYFVGAVADLVPYYRSARCVIAPMVSGTGISIKTIEALALGKPFVGTSKAFRGMPIEEIEHSGLMAHDDPQEYADAIVRALDDEQSAGACSRAVYEKVFSVKAASVSRDEAFRLATGV